MHHRGGHGQTERHEDGLASEGDTAGHVALDEVV
jgi:hypothetical protein